MSKLLDNSLFIKNRKKYEKIKEKVDGFNATYNKNNIVQDDIFNILDNYITRNEMSLELLRYPVKDMELCACTFLRHENIFVFINSAIPLSKQIFAAAHELYHIYRYFENNDLSLIENGSLLDSDTIDEEAKKAEDREANAFAALLLAPRNQLDEQSEVYKISYNSADIQVVLKIMDIFAIPYKAAVIRLFEEEKIDKDKAEKLLSIDINEVDKYVKLTGKAERWQEPTPTMVKFGNLSEKIHDIEIIEGVREERLNSDKERILELRKNLIDSAR